MTLCGPCGPLSEQLSKSSVVYLPQENKENDVRGCQGDEDAALPNGDSSREEAKDEAVEDSTSAQHLDGEKSTQHPVAVAPVLHLQTTDEGEDLHCVLEHCPKQCLVGEDDRVCEDDSTQRRR